MIWFSTPTMPKNTYLGIYRAIFTNEEQEKEASINEIVQKKQLSPKPQTKIPVNSEGIPLPEAYKGPHIFMCMIGGGHFAAMVVSLAPRQVKNPQATTGPLTKEAVVLAHKTFHRYTTRRKQGGSQSANDSAKGAAHSAGSSLRRYNEQALTDEVRQLLTSWKGMIDTSELLFIRATGTTNRRTLFGPYDDQVLRQNDPRIRGFPFSTRRATQNELMRSFVELTRVKVLEVDQEALAAKRLILKAHADPTLPNPEGKTPFDLCGDRTSRDAFRVCRHELPSPSTGYSWETSHVPAPLPRSEAQQRAAREHDEEQKRKAEQKKVDDERMAREEAEQKLRGDANRHFYMNIKTRHTNPSHDTLSYITYTYTYTHIKYAPYTGPPPSKRGIIVKRLSQPSSIPTRICVLTEKEISDSSDWDWDSEYQIGICHCHFVTFFLSSADSRRAIYILRSPPISSILTHSSMNFEIRSRA
ncbi:hypothetical protein EYC80_009081 [Monilinia laxa]|nr:hypothetical protein EYC80_009081 [Monilinia laxa]